MCFATISLKDGGLAQLRSVAERESIVSLV